MSTDNRTMLNDCEANTGWAGDDTATAIGTTGSFYEGSNGLSTQLSDTEEHMYTTQDSVGAGTFNIDLSDSTVYLLVKDNLGEPFANSGVMIVLGDGTDRIGYDVGGNDAIGLLLPTYFQCYKLDVSEPVATPGTAWFQFAGTEANLDQTQITQIGYGSHHLAKAVGSVDNVIMDAIRYIANDSYALTINGGTSGTPETMADVQGDDVTNGWGMIANPLGDQYQFFAPTEWGEATANADHYFEASNEQWFWIGDNAGGHAVGATHFPFRVIGNATDTGSFVITNVVIVNTGTGAEFDCSSSNVDTLEIDGCTMVGLASFDAPASGGTSRFCTNTLFQACGTVTFGGSDMSGCRFVESTVSADTGALVYNTLADPDGELDGCEFISHPTTAHHAIEFGTSAPNSGTSPSSMTLRNCVFTDFSASDAANDSTFLFPDTGSDVTWTLNLVGCSGNFSFKKARSGDTVNIVVDPVTALVNVDDETGADLENANVLMEAGDGTGDLPFEDSVSIARSGQTATVTHTAHGLSSGAKVRISGANQFEYNGIHTITVTGVNTYTFAVPDSFPLVRGRTTAIWSDTDDGGGNRSVALTASGDITVPLPANKSGDRLLLMVIISDDTEAVGSTPDGWTLEDSWDTTSFLGKGYLYSKASAEESEVTVAITGVSTGEIATFAWALRNVDSIESTTSVTTAGTGQPDPPNHDSATTDDALWIVFASIASASLGSSVTAPTSYSNLVYRELDDSGGTTNDIQLAVAERLLSAEDENPGAFSGFSAGLGNSYGVGTIKIIPANAAPTTPATGTIISTGVVLAGKTNASGQISASRSYTVDQNVRYRIAMATSSPLYKRVPEGDTQWLTNVIDNVDGLTITQQMTRDD